MRNPNWSNEEETAVCKLYSVMLTLQNSNQLGRGKGKQTKSGLIKEAQAGILSDRTRGSIEAKLMNVSHCRRLAGLQLVDGYKPLPHCSDSLLAAFNVTRSQQTSADGYHSINA